MIQELLSFVIILIFSLFIYFPMLKQVILNYKNSIMHMKAYMRTSGAANYYFWGVKKSIYSVYTVIYGIYVFIHFIFTICFIIRNTDFIILNISTTFFILLMGIQIVLTFILGKRSDDKYFNKPENRELLSQIKSYIRDKKLL